MKDFQSFYGTQAWKDCRRAYRKKVGGLCEMCLSEGKYNAGYFVHHKTPLTAENVNDPEITMNFDNLMLLCRYHHAQVHGSPRRYKFDDLGRVIPIGE